MPIKVLYIFIHAPWYGFLDARLKTRLGSMHIEFRRYAHANTPMLNAGADEHQTPSTPVVASKCCSALLIAGILDEARVRMKWTMGVLRPSSEAPLALLAHSRTCEGQRSGLNNNNNSSSTTNKNYNNDNNNKKQQKTTPPPNTEIFSRHPQRNSETGKSAAAVAWKWLLGSR
jgi:hypothetical protein